MYAGTSTQAKIKEMATHIKGVNTICGKLEKVLALSL